ncbi:MULTISPECIES: hypothetical protein [Streptomyces]|uniref:Uncharacterized protein n=1 Tax=Streptomyces glycanivorans TaxID=3033808 RepID=A0ABY9JGN8_9ACTN|nr:MULTISPECIES: hypothetical protein [unclassified Streptomyces]WLQ66892.1 hypothetical protein P8A20_26425 [Streptomyces sp. Alt3]WSQ80311.1 hypothetical protein OG725_25850 [Streptomyces sp. NBC_01213]WSR06347.1 hypothetical protein OG265_10185 [Streptomyces sp. NBC_01208]
MRLPQYSAPADRGAVRRRTVRPGALVAVVPLTPALGDCGTGAGPAPAEGGKSA